MVSIASGFQRPIAARLAARLSEPRRFINVVSGPRQVGKTTAVQHVVSESPLTALTASADEPTLQGGAWIETQWDAARLAATRAGTDGAVLVLDEIQKVPHWSETVKRLWDEDTRNHVPLKVIVLGSAPLLMAQGLTESLAGRFEVLHFPHWSWPEMRDAFGWTLGQYVCYGGYPGAAPLIAEPDRWRRYIRDSLIETSISRDVLLLSRVNKPALLRRLFELGCRYSGQELSFTKLLGQLQDAGNTTTLAHYLDLLAGAGMLSGLPKFAGDEARRRGSSPKFQVHNTALMTAMSGLTLDEAMADRSYWGRLVESAVGAHLVNAASAGDITLSWWRAGNHEVDFIAVDGQRVLSIEVKSGAQSGWHDGTAALRKTHRIDRSLVVGTGTLTLDEFLSQPIRHWTQD
jgi:predicted AAA+ superfamily ATPase